MGARALITLCVPLSVEQIDLSTIDLSTSNRSEVSRFYFCKTHRRKLFGSMSSCVSGVVYLNRKKI